MPAQLTITPTTIAFDPTAQGSSNVQLLLIENTGDVDIMLVRVDVTADGFGYSYGAFTWEGFFGETSLAPGASLVDQGARFTPQGPGLATCTYALLYRVVDPVTEEIIESTVNINATAWGVTSSAKLISATPNKLTFPKTAVGDTSTAQNVDIVNISEYKVDIIISAITVDAPFEITSTLPTLPYTIAGGASLSGNTLRISVAYSPIAEVHSSGYLTITSNATPNPLQVLLDGRSVIVISVEPLEGEDAEAIFAFGTPPNGGVSLKQADSTDLDCEEMQQWEKTFNFGEIGESKTLSQLLFKYEDLGEATVNMYAMTRNRILGSKLRSETTTIGTTQADEAPLQGKCDELIIEGELIDFIMYKDANSGPVSLIEFVYKYLTDQPLVGTESYLATHRRGGRGVYNILNPDFQLCVFSFYNSTTGRTVKYADPTNLDTEETCILCKLHNFDIIGFEKSAMNVWFKYEDRGKGKINIALVTKRGKLPDVIVPFGTDEAKQRILQAYADTNLTDELIQINYIRQPNQGELSIIEFNPKFEPRGGVVENT